MKYFAYGSNMDIAQMAVRCHKATLLGNGLLEGYRFRIDGRGFATVDRDQAASVPGLVWELSQEDEANLDRYEGVPRFYAKQTLEVEYGAQRGARAFGREIRHECEHLRNSALAGRLGRHRRWPSDRFRLEAPQSRPARCWSFVQAHPNAD